MSKQIRLRYGTFCSGIEAVSVAWKPLKWKPVYFSEIDKFCNAVLNHHYPKVPNLGDICKVKGENLESVDLLMAGTPCQSFSVIGERKGLDDPRGNLTFEFLRIIGETLPRLIVWENVPGVLSIDEGKVFGTILGKLAKFGYGWAYRILDAQYFGVPQQRRRVFLVGYYGDWRPAAGILFERESLRGNTAPRKRKRHKTLAFFGNCVKGSYSKEKILDRCYWDGSQTIPCLTAGLLSGNQMLLEDGRACVFWDKGRLRRPTPLECERLQGFPDNYTRIPYRKKPAEKCPKTPRYRALGNTIAIPVLRWIGKRINMVEKILAEGNK